MKHGHGSREEAQVLAREVLVLGFSVPGSSLEVAWGW